MNSRPNRKHNSPSSPPPAPLPALVTSPILDALPGPSAPLFAGTRKRGGGPEVLFVIVGGGGAGRRDSRCVVFVFRRPRPPGGEARGRSRPRAAASAGAGGPPPAGQGDHQAVLHVPAARGEPASPPSCRRACSLCRAVPCRAVRRRAAACRILPCEWFKCPQAIIRARSHFNKQGAWGPRVRA